MTEIDRGSTGPSAREQALLEAARRGDEGAYRRLVEPHRAELHALCYRMLGSLDDADDALQHEAAWSMPPMASWCRPVAQVRLGHEQVLAAFLLARKRG